MKILCLINIYYSITLLKKLDNKVLISHNKEQYKNLHTEEIYYSKN